MKNYFILLTVLLTFVLNGDNFFKTERMNILEKINLFGLTLTENTMAQGAELKINRVPISAKCNKCGKVFEVPHYNFFCPECEGILILQSGRELLVEYVDCD